MAIALVFDNSALHAVPDEIELSFVQIKSKIRGKAPCGGLFYQAPNFGKFVF